MKLTKAQIETLRDLSSGDASAYNLGISLNTLNALSLKGLVRLRRELGNMAFPRNAKWSITDAGRRALDDTNGN